MPAVPLFALSLLSAATLGYEILLMRLFSIIQWHHFAYMMISVALLGYGAAGAMVTLAQRWLAPRFEAVFVGGAILFGVFAVASFSVAQRVAFNPLEILWDPREPLRLLLIYLLLFVPFFCAATSVCLTFTRFNDQIPRIYSFDIGGAGLGRVAIIGVLFVLRPLDALRLLGASGVRPATDDKPYLFHFFKWRSLPEFLALKGRGGLPLLEWGYPVLIATLLQATLMALTLILFPLWVITRRKRTAHDSPLLKATSRSNAISFGGGDIRT
ncbi:hypothetical protein [Paraburkholderia franconis]|uniref:hypothetical protein n=1 Tax=Paraburkholderia franconis TaxID=2654983 RepID=UPI001D10D619|nr:hypothetical protein [Paraburkholderia franconis]